MKLIVGLGNPGEEYENTRHNAGKIALDWLADELGGVRNVRLVFPGTLMNASGTAVSRYKKTHELKNVLVIHDDLDIELGRVKMTFAKSSAGHKGVESVIRALGSKKFWRLRIGVAPRTKGRKKTTKQHGEREYLLSPFTLSERALITGNKEKTLEGVRLWIESPEKAMQYVNTD